MHRRRFILAGLAIAFITTGLRPAAAQDDEARHPRTIEVKDVAQWQRIVGFTMSPNGKWCGYFVRPNEGDAEILIKEITGDKQYKFKCGASSGSLKFSHDSKWAVYHQAPLEKETKGASRTRRPASNTAVLLNLATGDKTEFARARLSGFSGESARWLTVGKETPEGRPSGDAGWSGNDLILHDLRSDRQINIGNVQTYSFDKAGKWLAMTIDAEGQSGNAVQLFATSSARLVTLDSGKAKYRSINWTEEGDGLAVLKAIDDDKFEDPRHHVLAFQDLDARPPTKTVIDPQKESGIPDDMTISPNRSPAWTDALDAVLFGIHELKPKKKKNEDESDDKKESSTDETPAAGRPAAARSSRDNEDADVVIWHWKDERLQSMQQKQESRDKSFSFLCIYRVAEQTVFQVSDDEIPEASTAKPHRFAIGTDDSAYERLGNLDGQRFQDVYVIDLVTGKRKLAVEKLRWLRGVSPTGERFLYYRDGHYHVYDMESSQSTNITEGAPVRFINDEDDHNVHEPPTPLVGWASDGKHVLLSDNWDVWKVSVGDGEPVNLTVNGRDDAIRYRRHVRLDPDERGIDLSKPTYWTVYGERTKKNGVGRISPEKPGVDLLLWDDAAFRGPNKLEDRDVYYYSRETQQSAPEWYVTGPELDEAKQVTESNGQQKKFKWSSGARIVDYKSTNGAELQAALFLPADYIEGKKYPTVVYIYEKLSQRMNSYDAPRVGGFSTAMFTSRGYAVLMPDIVYRVNDPGLSAVECVLPALDAAVATGVVDADHVGLHGHSWGGYQTAFLITQTDRFHAALAGAPLTNLISMYSSIYWNSGSANQPIFESSQGRFTGGYWTTLDAYARNSPVYHAEEVTTPLLLLHNDQDGAVDWNQGIEYFNTLRRLEKPVVMLQYKGENHGVAKLPNRKDYTQRMLQFFDHYLKNEPAPKWWSEGIKHLDLKDHIQDLKKTTSPDRADNTSQAGARDDQ